MGIAVNDQAIWTLRDNVAELSCCELSGRIDPSRPNAGLHDVAIQDARHAIDLLRVYRSDVPYEKSWPLPVAETYVRGDDLVAIYQPADGWPFSPQLYWRANPLRAVDGVLASASLLVSVQTHLLDTFPQLTVSSLVPCEEALLVSPNGGAQPRAVRIESSQTISKTNEDCCVVRRLRDVPLSYVEIMPAVDFHANSLREEGNRTRFEWRLFAEFLEKGVIRRARVLAAIVSKDRDVEIAVACRKAIDGFELPLTT